MTLFRYQWPHHRLLDESLLHQELSSFLSRNSTVQASFARYYMKSMSTNDDATTETETRDGGSSTHLLFMNPGLDASIFDHDVSVATRRSQAVSQGIVIFRLLCSFTY
jgi:hypothetical protein